MNTSVLEEIGFSKGEVKVYFALLELGEATIGTIAKKSGVTAAKTYPILDKLAKKGLTTSVIKSDTHHFQAFNPKRILDYVEERKKKIEIEEDEIKKMLPSLIEKQTKEAIHSSRVYESYNGLRTLYDEITDHLALSKEEFIAFTIGDEYRDESLALFFDQYDFKRKRLGIRTKIIGVESQRKFFENVNLKERNLEIRYLPYTSVPQGVIIFADRVATMVWGKNPVAFVTQSKQVAESYKKFFGELWKVAQK